MNFYYKLQNNNHHRFQIWKGFFEIFQLQQGLKRDSTRCKALGKYELVNLSTVYVEFKINLYIINIIIYVYIIIYVNGIFIYIYILLSICTIYIDNI